MAGNCVTLARRHRIMNIGPILIRELRQQARQPSTYWLRVLGGGLVLAGAAWALSTLYVPTNTGLRIGGRLTDGRGLFWGLNKILALLLWVIAPILTADCLAREKREGTLGLLFLTPLQGVDVVIGKAASNSLRALMVLGAAYPVLLLPVLIGGIGWMDALRIFLLQLAILGLALASGVAASALTRDWLRARLLALTFTAGASLVFLVVYLGSWSVWRTYIATPASRAIRGGLPPAPRAPESLWSVFSNAFDVWAGNQLFQFRSLEGLLHGGGIPGNLTSIGLSLVVVGVCWGLVAASVRFAAAGLTTSWRRDASPPPANRITRELTRERFAVARQRSHRRRLLDRNPVAWLQHPKWTGRIARWVWCGWAGIEMCFLVTVLTDRPQRWQELQTLLTLFPVVLQIAVAFSAAASYRDERETGALELLLVTPLKLPSILRGRLQGLAETFAFALILLTVTRLAIGLELVPMTLRRPYPDLLSEIAPQCLWIWLEPLGMAVLALALGLRSHNVILATVKAVFLWKILPSLLAWVVEWTSGGFLLLIQPGRPSLSKTGWFDMLRVGMGPAGSDPWFHSLTVAIVRLGLVLLAWRRAKNALAHRQYLRPPTGRREVES